MKFQRCFLDFFLLETGFVLVEKKRLLYFFFLPNLLKWGDSYHCHRPVSFLFPGGPRGRELRSRNMAVIGGNRTVLATIAHASRLTNNR